MHTRVLPSGFTASIIGALQGDSDSEITPFLRFSPRDSRILVRSRGECARGRIRIGSLSPVLMLNGWSFAGAPIGRSNFGHFLLIHSLIFETQFAIFLAHFLIFPFPFFLVKSGVFSFSFSSR